MAYFDTTWYVNFGNGTSTGYYAVTVRPQNTAVAAGVLRRQFTAPTVGNERVFVCIIAGTTANTADATWTVTRGAKTTDGTATWQECSGAAGLNGDLTNTPNWTTVKGQAISLGVVIKRDNAASYQICSTAGTSGSGTEPAFSDTAGTTTVDNTATWTSLGPVGNFTGGQCPCPRLSIVCGTTYFLSGNTIYIGHNNAEVRTDSVNVTVSPVSAALAKIICHNSAGPYPPTSADWRTGAQVGNNGSVWGYSLRPQGPWFIYGLMISPNFGVTNSVNGTTFGNGTAGQLGWFWCERCCFSTGPSAPSSGGQATVMFGDTTMFNTITLVDCQVRFCSNSSSDAVILGHVQLTIRSTQGTPFFSQGTSTFFPQATQATGAPYSMFRFLSSATYGQHAEVLIEGVDLTNVVNYLYSSTVPCIGTITVKDCKLAPSMMMGSIGCTGQTVQIVRSDSGGNSYKSARYQFEGSEVTEALLTRVGGAEDSSGQAQSRKIITTTAPLWLKPFKAEPYAVWNNTTGSNVTVTVYGMTDAGSLLSDDIWLEIEYLGSSSSPVATITNTTKSTVVDTGTSVATDPDSTWTTPPADTARFDSGNTTWAAIDSTGRVAYLFGTPGGNQTGARSSASRTTGKYYFEIQFTKSFSTGNSAGILATTGTLTDLANGLKSTRVAQSGVIHSNGTNSGKTVSALVAGEMLCFAMDLTARRGWIRRNNGNWNGDAAANPATNTGGVTIEATLGFAPAVSFGGGGAQASDTFMLNTGMDPFSYTAPSGFGNWPTDTVAPTYPTKFKLTKTLSSPQPAMPGFIEVRVCCAKPSTTFFIDPKPVLS